MTEFKARLNPEDAAAEMLRRNRSRESLVGFAQNIQIPGAPSAASDRVNAWEERPDDDFDALGIDDHLLAPIGLGVSSLHVFLMQKIQTTMETPYGKLMIFMPPGAAKALALDTPIATPEGWSTIGELNVGDQVFGSDGKPCNIVRVSEVFKNRPCYRVRTDCGDEIIADADHEWLVRLCGKHPVFKLKQTWELARSRTKRPMIQRAEALQLPEKELPIDPYLLGVWLGDGNSAGMRITSSVEDQIFVRSELERLGYQTTNQSVDTNFGVLAVRGLFVKFGLVNDPDHNTYGSKHIPDIYMRASYQQRLSLVQGLIDTDGTVCRRRGCATFCNTNKELALQFRELVRSLGVKAGWSESKAVCNGKDCGFAYKVSFYHEKAARMPRKAALCRNQYRTPNTYVEAHLLNEKLDTVCIEVDSPDHLFLAGESMTPTHNSTYGSVIAPTWKMGKVAGTQIILGSYNTALAKKHGSRGRNIVSQDIYLGAFNAMITPGSQAKEFWTLTNGSEYMSGGLQSGLTGNRADGLIIDDPVRGRADAKSENIQIKTIDAYEDDAQTRLKPGAWQILIQTRWDVADLAGMILPADYGGESGLIQCRDGMDWEVINLPAKAKYADDPLGRKVGEYLWPEWFDAKHWYQYEPRPGDPKSPNQRRWDSLFQQEPRPDSGNQWDEGFTQWYQPGTEPKYLVKFFASDYAVTDVRDSDDPDFTEHGIAGLDENGHLWLVDWYFSQHTTNHTIKALIDLCKAHNVRMGFGEQGIIRRAIESQFETQQREAGYYLSATYLPHIGDKVAKFAEARAMGSAGKVHVPDTPWGRRLHKQLTVFPSTASKDDGVDVLSLFARGAKDMVWSRDLVTPEKKKGIVFGSWEWLTHNEAPAAPQSRWK